MTWQRGNTKNGHEALASEDWDGISGKTYEGNTSSGKKGSQHDGDGAFSRTRKIEPYNYTMRIRWFTPFDNCKETRI